MRCLRTLCLLRTAIHTAPRCAAGGRCVGLGGAGGIHFSPSPFSRGVCVCNLMPVELCFWPQPQLGGLAVSARPRPPYHSVPGGSGPCGDLCLQRELVQLRLHLCTRSPLGPCPPGKRGETRLSHSSPFPSSHRWERSGKGLGLCGGGGSQVKGISCQSFRVPHVDTGVLSLDPAPAPSAPTL